MGVFKVNQRIMAPDQHGGSCSLSAISVSVNSLFLINVREVNIAGVGQQHDQDYIHNEDFITVNQ